MFHVKRPDVPRSLPILTDAQRDRLQHFQKLALGFNQKLNLYSGASAEHFWQRHVMHSLALAVRPFPPGARVVDWGTGGGLPGLPLAVLFPDAEFVLVDSVGKKIRAVQTMARRLGLDNVTAWHGRAEAWEGGATHSVSRATSPLAVLWGWHARVAQPLPTEAGTWPPGLYCLKGGDLDDEIGELMAAAPQLTVTRTPLPELLTDPYFRTKELLSVVG